MSFRVRPAHILGAALLSLALFGCRGNGVGDPCIPEVVPPGGFAPTESTLETSSVQCRTRTCVVFQLDGDPESICSADNPTDCVAQSEVDDKVFCTCRCSTASGESNVPLCSCPNGFACTDVIESGGQGIQGGYCIRCQCPSDGSGLDPAVFPECDNCNS